MIHCAYMSKQALLRKSSSEYCNPDNTPGKPQLILDIGNASTELIEIVKYVSTAYVS